jgi:hypothetical protein
LRTTSRSRSNERNLSHDLVGRILDHQNSVSTRSERLNDAHAWMASQYLEVINDRRRSHGIQPADEPKHPGSAMSRLALIVTR